MGQGSWCKKSVVYADLAYLLMHSHCINTHYPLRVELYLMHFNACEYLKYLVLININLFGPDQRFSF